MRSTNHKPLSLMLAKSMSTALVVTATTLALLTAPQPIRADPPDTGPVVMRGEYEGLAWWFVDPDTGLTTFYGGDIQTICENDPNMFGSEEGWSVVQYLIKEGRSDTVWNDLERGKDVEASLWDSPPPFRLPQLCADILSREPIAEGSARVKVNLINVHFAPDPDAKGRSHINSSAEGMMTKPTGETIRVHSRSKCNWPAGESIDTVYECDAAVEVR